VVERTREIGVKRAIGAGAATSAIHLRSSSDRATMPSL
jgi:hypothetical protein